MQVDDRILTNVLLYGSKISGRQVVNQVKCFKEESHMGRRWPGKTAGGIGFALNFLWLLSFFQEKESNNAAT